MYDFSINQLFCPLAENFGTFISSSPYYILNCQAQNTLILKFISDLIVFLVSSVKFVLGASAVVTGRLGIPGTVSSILGAITGVIIFTYLGGYIKAWLIKTYPKKFGSKFSRVSRFMVKVRQHSGLTGIAFLTPILLSIPVGVFLALDLTSHKMKIVSSMVLSCCFWSAVFFVPYFVFHINVIHWVKNMF